MSDALTVLSESLPLEPKPNPGQLSFEDVEPVTGDLFPETKLKPEEVPDERYTPRSVFEPLNAEFNFTLDVCATPESAKCPRFFTKEQDGLKHSWTNERVWCNPPYSDIEPWVKKAWISYANVLVMLLPAWTDRDWWEKHVEPYRDGRGSPWEVPGVRLTTRFLRGRIRFGFPGNPEGIGTGSPNFWGVLLIWRVQP